MKPLSCSQNAEGNRREGKHRSGHRSEESRLPADRGAAGGCRTPALCARRAGFPGSFFLQIPGGRGAQDPGQIGVSPGAPRQLRSCARCAQRANRSEEEAINRETAPQECPGTVSPDLEAILVGPPFSALTGMMTATQAPQFRAAKQPDRRGDRVGWRRDQMGFQERCCLGSSNGGRAGWHFAMPGTG